MFTANNLSQDYANLDVFATKNTTADQYYKL